jgi:DNA (cytosine-5)-methyltransferase 1
VTTYYNENDRFAAAWLRELIRAGHLPAGDVDERSIEDVEPKDLKGYTQLHWFAGVGGWPYALRLAGWPDDRPVWTGSCPCQPFSAAGCAKGLGDERHLWPAFYRLISKCRPPIVLGEQVASRAGREWLSGIRVDLERVGYAVGAADLCAAGVGALHIRQRLWWVANADGLRCEGVRPAAERPWSWEQFKGLVQAEVQSSVPTGRYRALSHGVPARVGRLRGYGNAIVPQVAAEFVKAIL